MMMKDYKGYEIERVTRNTYVIRKGAARWSQCPAAIRRPTRPQRSSLTIWQSERSFYHVQV